MQKTNFNLFYSLLTPPLKNGCVQGWYNCDTGLIRDVILKKKYSRTTSENKGRKTLPHLPNVKGVVKDNNSRI
jgi:hypothetical protein